MNKEERRDNLGAPRIVSYAVGDYLWHCLVCGALVADAANHYEWHSAIEKVEADA